MKKNHLKLIAIALFIGTSFAIQSCSKDDDAIQTLPPVGIALDPNNFKGDIPNGQIVTLDPTIIYKLTGPIIIKDGGRLVIPAGTKIIATGTTLSYILAEQGGQFYANGTAGSPVVFTSSAATPGSWGGIVLCGKATINTGATATSEIGNATYGGTIDTDNSGALSYVRIEYAGALYSAGKKFNGLSLFGVGNATSIGYVSVIKGSDDGIQLYGGTVNVSNIVSIANEDDAFEWTDGWVGTAAGIYTMRKADGTGNTGIKGSNNATNNNATPISNPTITNVTFIGGTSGEANGIQLKLGTYAKIDNVVLSNWNTGINIESDASVTNFNGKKRITNALFDANVTTKIALKSSLGANVPIVDTTYTEKATATGAGNGISAPLWAAGWAGL